MRVSFCHPTFIGVAAVVDIHGRGAGEPRIVIIVMITSAFQSRLQLEYKPSRFVVHFLTLFLGMASLRVSVLPRLDMRTTLKSLLAFTLLLLHVASLHIVHALMNL